MIHETVGVVVYYKDQYVGTCPVEVFHYNSHFNIPEMGQNSNYNQRLSYEIAVDDSLKAYFVNNGRIVIGRGAFESSVGSNGIGESGDGNHPGRFQHTGLCNKQQHQLFHSKQLLADKFHHFPYLPEAYHHSKI